MYGSFWTCPCTGVSLTPIHMALPQDRVDALRFDLLLGVFGLDDKFDGRPACASVCGAVAGWRAGGNGACVCVCVCVTLLPGCGDALPQPLWLLGADLTLPPLHTPTHPLPPSHPPTFSLQITLTYQGLTLNNSPGSAFLQLLGIHPQDLTIDIVVLCCYYLALVSIQSNALAVCCVCGGGRWRRLGGRALRPRAHRRSHASSHSRCLLMLLRAPRPLQALLAFLVMYLVMPRARLRRWLQRRSCGATRAECQWRGTHAPSQTQHIAAAVRCRLLTNKTQPLRTAPPCPLVYSLFSCTAPP